MKNWVWHIGVAAALGMLFAACSSNDKVSGSSLETENSIAVALAVRQSDGSPAARTKVFVRPSDFLAWANDLSFDRDYKDGGSPVVVSDSASGVLNLETDDQGQLDLPRLRPGSYMIEARQKTAKAVIEVVITDSSKESVSLAMDKPGTIKGRVNLPEDLPSVIVGIQGLDYFVETDSEGNFEFPSVPAGSFNVVSFVFHVYKSLDGNGNAVPYYYYLQVGNQKAEVVPDKVSDGLEIGLKVVPQDTVKKDSVQKDTLQKDTAQKDSEDVYPEILFENFEDSISFGWYTSVSRYGSATLDAVRDEDRDGLVAHFEYQNDSNYNWVLMGHAFKQASDLTDLDSVVFWARAGLADSTQWISLSFDVLMDSVDLEKYGYENGKAWVHMNVDTAWHRYVVTPEDLIETDSLKNGGNIGWDAVKDHVTNLNFFGGGQGGPFDLWIDDIYIYGVKGLEK